VYGFSLDCTFSERQYIVFLSTTTQAKEYIMKLKRRKVGDRSYELVDASTLELIATAVNTSTGGDDYPWDWHLRNGLHFGGTAHVRKEGGVQATLKDVVDYIESGINQYGTREDDGF